MLDLNKLEGTKKKDYEASLLRKLLRILSLPIANALKNSFITPNMITFFYLILSFPIAYLFYLNTAKTNLIGAFLLFLILILDKVDGSLARIKGIQNDYGFWLDRVLNDFSRIVIFLGVTWGAANQFGDIYWLFGFLLISSYLLMAITYEIFRFLFSEGNNFISGFKSKMWIVRQVYYGDPLASVLLILFALFNRLDLFLILVGSYGILSVIIQTIIFTIKAKRYDKGNSQD
ncbi:MAG: CDP-alcohol phosphatidyltransferase family protein [Candidatus Nanoarchaeia archaeon]|nr:CDP-alcohol phosphatidyltransferase family protein [Candidatus Nanoarchaeia archaeon]